LCNSQSLLVKAAKRIAAAYVEATCAVCTVCIDGVSPFENPDAHTCAYGDELYTNYAAQIHSPYQYVTDYLCPSHGQRWVHVAHAKQQDADGFSQDRCGCNWAGDKVHSSADSIGVERRAAAHAFWNHQAVFCTYYHEEREFVSHAEQAEIDQERGLLVIYLTRMLKSYNQTFDK
jgi:hypothetical protein